MTLKRCIPKFTILKDFRCPEPVISSSAATFIKRCVVCFITDNQCRKMALNPLLRSFRTLTPCLGRVKTQRPSKSASHSFIYPQTTRSNCSTRPFLQMANYPAAGQMSSRFPVGLAFSSTTPKTVKQLPQRHMQRHKPLHFTVVFVCQCVRFGSLHASPCTPTHTFPHPDSFLLQAVAILNFACASTSQW